MINKDNNTDFFGKSINGKEHQLSIGSSFEEGREEVLLDILYLFPAFLNLFFHKKNMR